MVWKKGKTMPKFKAVKVNETQHWNEEFRKKFGITKIFGVYVFNPNEATNCCELTPSYELNFVHSDAECDDELSDEMREEMFDKIMEGDIHTEPVTYMHCRDIDRMKTIDIGEFETIEDAIEYCQGNWV